MIFFSIYIWKICNFLKFVLFNNDEEKLVVMVQAQKKYKI